MALIALPPAYATVFPAGINPYLRPTVPATGNAAVRPPPRTTPSAPNLIFSLKYSAALADPFNSSP